MGVTVQDLEKKAEQGNMLYCPCCDSEYSADAGDYFWMNREEVFTCQHCEDELVLVHKRISYVRV